MKLVNILSGLNKGWAIFLVIVSASGIGGGAYAAWTASLHVEGTVQTGDVDVVWDMQSDAEFVGIFDLATGQVVNGPIPVGKDFSDCLSSLEPGTIDRTVSFQLVNAFPSYTCEITLGALVSGSVPVHISNIEQEVLDAAGNPVLDTEINMNVEFTRKTEVDEGVFRCELDQPVEVGTQLHRGDRFCAIISVHATENARQEHTYSGSLLIDLIQWNFSENVVIPPNNDPISVDDTFDALGNTELVVGGALPGTPATQSTVSSVLSNDSDPDSDLILVVPFVGATANDGFVDLNALGRFRYQPPVAFNGPDTFPYSIDDGNGGTANGLVTINVTDMVWYVDNTGSTSGDGRSHNPFDSLLPLTTGGSADALDNAGDTIFVHQGSGPTQGGIVLQPDQQLIGQGVALSVPPFLPDPLVTATGEPTVLASTGEAIVLASGNTVRGLNVRSAAGDGIIGLGVGTLAIRDVPLVDAAGGSGLVISGGTSPVVVVDSVVVNNPSGTGIDLNNNGAGSFTFTEVNITNSGGTGLRANLSGSLRVGGGATPNVISSTNGTGLNVTNTSIVAGGLTFQSISSSNTTTGIVLNNTGSSGGLTITGNVAAGSGGTISGTTGDGVSLVNTEIVSMSLVGINSTGGSGISGNTVNGFSGADLDLSNIGDADGEHGITFNNLIGNNSITGTVIKNAADHNVRVVNTTGTMASLVVADSVFQGVGASHGGSGVFVELSGPAVISNLVIGGGTPATDDANNTRFLDMDGLGIDLRGSASGGTFTSVVIDDVQVLRAQAGGVLLATDANVAGVGGGTFSLTNSEIEGDNATAIGVGADGNSAAVVTIRNNTARVINRPVFGFGVSVIGARADGNSSSDAPDLRVTIDSNSISGGDAFGINLASRGSAGSLDAKIVDNVITDVLDDGVRVRAGNGTASESDTVRVYLEGNDATTGVLGDGYDLRDQSNLTTFQIGCDGAAHTECAALIAGPGAMDDQGVLALHGNTGTTLFLGISDIPVFEIIDLTAVPAP